MFVTCQAGFQDLLVAELADRGYAAEQEGPGWARVKKEDSPASPLPPETGVPSDLAFAHAVIDRATEFRAESVNALAQGLADAFLESLRGIRVEGPWPCVFQFPAEIVGLGRRVSGVEKAFLEILRRKLPRVAKLAMADLPRGVQAVRGWGVYFTDFGAAFAGSQLWVNGPRRMADDERAPSRSYLKIEEAYVVFGREPKPEETVADLGASPGGWCFSAAKRGSRVLAIDNGPLKGGALDHPLIEHRRTDAFSFTPESGQSFDWLFCDLVDDPNHVMANLVTPWLTRGWCRNFVINLKFGRVAPIAFLRELQSPQGVFAKHAPGFRVRHLYHDREEFTIVGHVSRGAEVSPSAEG